MVLVSPAPALLDISVLSLYYTKDVLLANLPVVVFYGPSTTTNTTLNSSRIQAHVYSLAGFQSFPRLTISPTSPLYTAVNHLPEDKQGDEICRGLAVSLLKYFAEMPKAVRSSLTELAALGRSDSMAPAMFDEMHAGDLAAQMVQVENIHDIANHILVALSQKHVSWTGIDLVLPTGSIERTELPEDPDEKFLYTDDGSPFVDYGQYSSLVKLFGSPTFLPTSKLKRAPSRLTSISKMRILAKDQKESLRREMCEFLDTEERYVGKLYDLVNSVAVEFARNVRGKPVQNSTASERAMQRLFPGSLTKILNVNTCFMKHVRNLLEQSENDAISDIQGLTAADGHGSLRHRGRPKDLTGTEDFARALLDWFPRFKDPYQDYLRASAEFPRILNDFLRDSASHFSQQIHATGEQRLRSWLIEPVQRLPRYSLFIDNMVNLLPATHPAMSKFFKARDIITDICALDNDDVDDGKKAASRLKDLVSGWPASFSPCGRLISAVDVAELKAPYNVGTAGKDGQASMLLLFPDSLVVVRKSSTTSLSARGVLAEVDRPSPKVLFTSHNSTFTATAQKGLTFAFSFELCDTRFTESSDGRLVSMACVRRSDIVDSHIVTSRRCHAITKVYSLQSSYESKAARWSEEVARASIEERFPEKLRESEQWALRSISPGSDTLGVLATICEHDCTDVDGARVVIGRPRVKIMVDQHHKDRRYSAGNRGQDITGYIIKLASDRYRLEFEGTNNSSFNSTDNITTGDFIGVFLRRLGNLLRSCNQPQDLESAQAHISHHQKIVETLPIRMRSEEAQVRRFRPLSPVKVLSNFLGSPIKDSFVTSKELIGDPFSKEISTMLPPNRLPVRSSSRQKPAEVSHKSTLVDVGTTENRDSIGHLERTFSAYVSALRSRSGNMVGKVLRGRASADELVVNELYNTLVEDPSKIQAAAEVSVDVLFVAFEKFLRKAWTERLGSVIGSKMLVDLQSILDSPRSGQVSDRVNYLLGEMTPQNRRAFTSLIKLLSDLLDASGNDGDRGALTATFAEALIFEGNPHDYIALLDRLVDDYDLLLEGSNIALDANACAYIDVKLGDGASGAAEDSIVSNSSDPLKRSRSINTGSLSSNASSLRKRFGFGTSNRDNSRADESKVGSVWRTLSKNGKSPADGEYQLPAVARPQPSSLSKSLLLRSRSTDTDNRKPLPSRPVSRDRPTSSSSQSQENSPLRPGSAHNTLSGLSTIGEGASEKVCTPRKSRRSSLSDLQIASNPATAYVPSPAELRKVNLPEKSMQNGRASLRTPSPKKLQPPPRKESTPLRSSLTYRKENSPAPRNTLRERAVNRKSDEVVITSFSPQKRKDPNTGIPVPRNILQERESPNNNTNLPKKSQSSPQKLRIQSPQKLRERLQNEHKAIQAASGTLQAELSKIATDLSALNVSGPAFLSTTTAPPDYIMPLGNRLSSLETTLSTTYSAFSSHIASIRADLDSSLTVSEKKCKALDELYREANAENEALYERFNHDLGKVLRGVKAGKGEEEVRSKLREGQEEAGRLKRENMRLKRECVGLRSQLKSAD